MYALLAALLALSQSLPSSVDTLFVQVAPALRPLGEAVRTLDQDRAVVLLHGLSIHPLNHKCIARAELHIWQKPGSLLVKQLAHDADVYAFAYAQNAPVEYVADTPLLANCIQRLRQLGYRSIVLVGYSAGGLIARQFVEDVPDSGVTKVIQVDAPNGGSSWAELRAIFPFQEDFLYSLSKEARLVVNRSRTDKKIPAGVEFACVVGTGGVGGDGLVLARCQWTEDLKRQGIPAYPVHTTHWQVVRIRPGVSLIAELVQKPQPRWAPAQVTAAHWLILGK